MKNLNRYCGRLLYVYDYAAGRERTEEQCTKEEALNAIRKLFYIEGNNKTVKNLCNKETSWAPGIKADMIEDFKHWSNEEAYKHYLHNKREIAAAGKLDSYFRDCGNILGVGPYLNVPPWTFIAWIKSMERLPWSLVLTIEKFGNEEFTIEQLKTEWEVTKNDIKDAARIES